MKGPVDHSRYMNKKITVLKRPNASNDPTSPVATNDALTTSVGLLKRPWRRVKRKQEPKAIFVLARRNYQVYTNIGFSRRATRRFLTVLDTGAGSSSLRKDLLPPEAWKDIRPLTQKTRIRDAGNRSVAILGTVNLAVELGSRTEMVTFKVVERLAVDLILGCDFCDKHDQHRRIRRRHLSANRT